MWRQNVKRELIGFRMERRGITHSGVQVLGPAKEVVRVAIVWYAITCGVYVGLVLFP